MLEEQLAGVVEKKPPDRLQNVGKEQSGFLGGSQRGPTPLQCAVAALLLVERNLCPL